MYPNNVIKGNSVSVFDFIDRVIHRIDYFCFSNKINITEENEKKLDGFCQIGTETYNFLHSRFSEIMINASEIIEIMSKDSKILEFAEVKDISNSELSKEIESFILVKEFIRSGIYKLLFETLMFSNPSNESKTLIINDMAEFYDNINTDCLTLSDKSLIEYSKEINKPFSESELAEFEEKE